MATLSERWGNYRPSKTAYFWSCVVAIVGTMLVGFFWGGWVTQATAQRMAQEAADGARTKLAADLCVQRFESDANAKAELAQLKGTSAWQRDDFIVKGGWATLPGMKDPIAGVADLCASQLVTVTLPETKPAGTSG